MTSPTLRSQISLAKCSARKRSGRPVASANWLGNNVEVFVVKIVFAGHAWFSSGYTLRLIVRVLGHRLADEVGVATGGRKIGGVRNARERRIDFGLAPAFLVLEELGILPVGSRGRNPAIPRAGRTSTVSKPCMAHWKPIC